MPEFLGELLLMIYVVITGCMIYEFMREYKLKPNKLKYVVSVIGVCIIWPLLFLQVLLGFGKNDE